LSTLPALATRRGLTGLAWLASLRRLTGLSIRVRLGTLTWLTRLAGLSRLSASIASISSIREQGLALLGDRVVRLFDLVLLLVGELQIFLNGRVVEQAVVRTS